MSSVNPLHIGALLVIVIFSLFFKLSDAKLELSEAKSSFKESEKLAVDVKSLKIVYADKKKTKKALERIVSNRALRSADLIVKKNKDSMRITAKSIEASSLNFLLGKVLNASFNVTQLKIKRLSEEKASLVMEIKW